ncbi:transposase [Ktedonobacter sp. SOSP1-52]|uniref:transposase n=1 Tax=Ktedonobacter sp. SOSP1-52 TaxID=2778366 RepID=UPI001F19A7F4|nr:transposase [Ktedonobacter sp. SOSP1-52]
MEFPCLSNRPVKPLALAIGIEGPFLHAEKRLAKAQQALSRKKRGSKRRKKAVQRVARLHRRVRNQPNDYLHQWSRRLVETYETIVFEGIAPTTLSRRARPKQDEETGKSLPNGASAKSGLNKSIFFYLPRLFKKPWDIFLHILTKVNFACYICLQRCKTETINLQGGILRQRSCTCHDYLQ